MYNKVFISYASEEGELARELSLILLKKGLDVWFDKNESRVGDIIRRNIDSALANCDYGIVLLSHNYFKKEWPQRELEALTYLENKKGKIILPVLIGLNEDDLLEYSPLLASKLHLSIDVLGIVKVAEYVFDAIVTDKYSYKFSKPQSIIGISGASCSGKTWLAEKISAIRPNCVSIFDLDGFYKKKKEIEGLSFKRDNPKSIDFHKAIECLERLRTGETVLVPVFNYGVSGMPVQRLIKPAPIILLEGLFVFWEKHLLDMMDYKIWIETHDELRLMRRIQRDTVRRGKTIDEIIDRYQTDVRPGYQEFVAPLKEHADHIIPNNGRTNEDIPNYLRPIIDYIDRLLDRNGNY